MKPLADKPHVVTIPYPSEVWRAAMENANRADKEFVPLVLRGASLIELKKLRAKLAKRKNA
uniref:Uncharacterized protein n=1 Tax=viral metagenome TaxID=1070528 RepID=A0A6M3L005_9ZZZZ